MASQAVEPYVGIRPFGVNDADQYFGREIEASEARTLALSRRLLVIHGPTCVGKTSLVSAGLLAHVDQYSAQSLPIGRPARVSAFPTTATPVYNPYVVELLSSWAPRLATRQLQSLTIREFLEGLPVSRDRYDDGLPLLVVIDQFEEVYRDVPEWAGHREEFLRQLGDAVDRIDRLRLVLVMTDDVVGDFLPYEGDLSRRGNRSRLHLGPLDVGAALQAIIRPLEAVDRAFAPDVAEELVERLRTTTITNALGDSRTITSPHVEPLNLQVVCQALWRALPADTRIVTAGDLGDYGDVESALTTYCVRAVVEVAEQLDVPETKVWEWLERTFITDLGTRGAAYEGVLYTAGMPNTMARAFESQRILRSEKRSGSVWFELVHDGLIEPIRHGRRLAGGLDVDAAPHTMQDIYLRMAEAALHDNMLPLAEHYASSAVSLGEGDLGTLAEAATLLGKIEANLARSASGDRAAGMYDSAVDHYRRAIELYETGMNSLAAGSVFANLGRLLLERSRPTDAVGALRNAVQRRPSDPDVRMDLARARAAMGQAALSDYNAVIGLQPDHVEALLARGMFYIERGDAVRGLDDIEKAIRLQDDVAGRTDVEAARAQARSLLERS